MEPDVKTLENCQQELLKLKIIRGYGADFVDLGSWFISFLYFFAEGTHNVCTFWLIFTKRVMLWCTTNIRLRLSRAQITSMPFLSGARWSAFMLPYGHEMCLVSAAFDLSRCGRRATWARS